MCKLWFYVVDCFHVIRHTKEYESNKLVLNQNIAN